MKSLFEMISKKAEWVEFDTAPPHDEVGCYITIDNIESLINEVISQRLGEPVAEVAMKKFADFMQPQPYLKWHQPNHEIGTKLYALNIES